MMISERLGLVLNLCNAIHDHKTNCNTPCNVSISQLHKAACVLSRELTDTHEKLMAAEALGRAPRY